MKDCGVPSFAEIEVNFDDFQAQALINSLAVFRPASCMVMTYRALHGSLTSQAV